MRIGLWENPIKQRGTILLFPGRSEYIEKYGRTIGCLEQLGFHILVIDWRGQGLADRALPDRMIGHVNSYADYQLDVAAMIKAASDLALPKPWFLFGHSLGACIGLRALLGDLPVQACVFTSPMWNLKMPLPRRLAAWLYSWAATALGKGHLYAPGTSASSYVLNTAFSQNRLTDDSEMYAYFITQANHLQEHQIGGPSTAWLFETLRETRHLSNQALPNLSCVSLCGTRDEVVDVSCIEKRMADWPRGRIEILEGKHDLLSETPTIRERVLAVVDKQFVTSDHVSSHS